MNKRRMTRIALFSAAVTLAALLAACGAPANPPQSPGNGAQASMPTTSDGEPVGADRVPPGQKLQEGPKLDSKHGIEPAATPPHE